jgi:hypothetical protein
MFLMSGGSKLAGVPAMVGVFDQIGVGQWFRYLTGAIEVISGIALRILSVAIFGAWLIVPTMLGAIAANVFVIHVSPALLLLLWWQRWSSPGFDVVNFECLDQPIALPEELSHDRERGSNTQSLPGS